MRCHTDRTNTRTAAAMRDAESLVEIEVAHISTELGRGTMSDKGIQIGPVDIDLPASGVDNITDLNDGFLEHAVCRRIGHHDGSQRLAMCFGFGPEIIQIDIAILVAFDDHNLHTGHRCRCRVGAMRRLWNETDIAMRLSTRFVIAGNGQQTRKFTLRSGIWLH